MLSSNIFYSGYNIFFSIMSLFIGIGSVFLIANSNRFRSMLLFQIGGLAMIFLTYITTQDHLLYSLGLNFRFAAFAQIMTSILISVLWINAATDLYSHRLANRETLTIYTTLALTLCFYYSFAGYNSAYITLLRQLFPLIGISLLFVVSVLKLSQRPSVGSSLLCFALLMLGGKLVVSAFFFEYNRLNLNLFNWLWIYVFTVSIIFMRFDLYKEELARCWNSLDKLNLQIMNMIDLSPFPIVIARLSDRKLITLNAKASLLFGIGHKEIGYRQLSDIMIDAQNNEKFQQTIQENGSVDNFDVMVCNLISTSPFWMSASAKILEYNNETAVFITFQDIIYRKEREANLQNQANKDPLTLAWNRHYFEKIVPQRISECIRNTRNFSLLLLDADKFKKINETYGHKIGDKVLIGLAEICRSSLREDDIIARFGGEKFAIFLNDTNSKAAAHIAERLVQNTAQTEFKGDDDALIKVTVSAGVVSSEKTASFEVLMRQADEALYLAKRGGRNRIALYDEQEVKKYKRRKTKTTKQRDIHPIFQNEDNEEISLLGNYESKMLEKQK